MYTNRRYDRYVWRALLVTLCAVLLAVATVAGAAEGRFLAKEEIILYGMGLKVEPAKQVVPKNIATIVSTYLQVPTLPNVDIPPLPTDAKVKATLRGPGLETPLELSVKANTPFTIPPLTVPGIYSLENIRLESGGSVLLRGNPESVSIEIIEKLLVTQITARPLTAQEIKDKGIVYDKSNFQAYNFTAAFAVGAGEEIKLDMPVLLPSLASAQDVTLNGVGIGSLPEPQLKDVRTIIPDSLKLAQTRIPNLSISTFNLKTVEYKGNDFVLPPIPGVIVIPGDIGFLNQYFSVMLMVGNVAPEYSNLVVKDITATLLLPGGNDKIVGTSDDPLAMATTTSGQSPTIRAVVQPGADGKLGTADDIVSLAPGQTGNAEFLVEGRREGSHSIEIEIAGTLEGLPVGPVTVRGRAVGSVLVRNPNFTLTFTHPDIVNAGEEYSLDVTATNTSESPANFVSLNLHPQQISGAELVGEGSREIETIPPGDSATVSFNLRSKVNGKIFAATLDSDEQVAGRFQLKTSVGELGIPLSPDSLVLPKEAGSLPKALRDAAIGLLGKAYAVATAPAAALPKDVLRFSKKIVWDRGIEVAEAGFRHALHEPLADSAAQLLLDFLGSNYTRLAEFNPKATDYAAAVEDYVGFDDLRRRSVRGDVLADAVAALLKPGLASKGSGDFQRDLASSIAYRPEHISVIVDSGSNPLPVSLTLMDSQGRRLGGIGEKGKIVKEIPFGDYLTFREQTATSGQMAIVAAPTAGSFRIRLEQVPGADPTGTFTLGVVAPDAGGTLQQRTFSGLTSTGLPVVELPGSPYSFTVELYTNGVPQNGSPQPATNSRPIPDPPPSVISVVQQPEADKIANDCGTWRFGRVVAALFSEEVTPASAQDKLARNLISNYTMADNQVVGVALQPGRRIAFLALRDPIGPFVSRSVTFDNIIDRRGNAMGSQTVPIEATIEDPAAVVSGKVLQPDGTPLAGAEVRLFTRIEELTEDGCMPLWYGIGSKYTGNDAAFGWDYVLKQTNKIVAVNPNDSEYRTLPFTVARNGQRLNVNVVFLGRGTLTGKVLGEDAITPLKDAQVRVTSLTDNSQYGFTTDATGRYTIPKIPVGNLIVEAVHLGTNSKITQSGYMGAAGTTVEMNLVLLTEALRKVTVKNGSLTGHVLRYDRSTIVAGVPVYGYYQNNSQEGVLCPLIPGPDGPVRPPECAIASATTDTAGAYSFPELPAGAYRIYTFDQAAFQEGNARISVAPDSAATANILLNGGFGTIRGVVKDADGNPVANADVGGGVSLARTDANGLFTLTDVPVGQRTIVAVSQALLAQGEAVVDVSTPGGEYGATIILQSQGGIYGTVLTAGGSPASGIKVNLLQGDGLVSATTTNASGAYQFPNVPVAGGEYTVSAFLPDLSDGNLATTAIRFQGQRVRLDLTFKGRGTVTGGIFDSDGNTPLVGKVSVSGLRVVAARSGEELVGLRFEYTQHLQVMDTTFSSNRFTFNDVFVGPFVITAAGAFSPDPVTFAGEIAANGETQDLTIRLTPTSVITGTVYGPDGVSVAKNALVTFKSDEFKTICSENEMGDTVCDSIPQGIQSETAVSDEFGRFTLPLVNAGKFTLTVEDRDAAGNPTGRIGKMNGLVRAGQSADVVLRLLARAPVRVSVYAHNSTTPISKAWVTVTEAGTMGATARPRYQADAEGVLLLSGPDAVSEGSFTVMAESNDGFVGRASGKVVVDGTEVAIKVYLFDHTVTVKGTVYRPNGITPVANAEVSIANAQGDLAFAVTNANGEYSQDYIPLGDFRVEVFEAATGRRGFAAATAYLSTPVVTVNVSEMAIGQVQGTIYQSGSLAPLSRWQVTLSQTSPSGRGLALVATTGLDGRFQFPGVPVGEFRINAAATGQQTVSAQGYLTREGEIVDIPLVVSLVKPARGAIFGWVYRPDGTPAADSTVCLNPTVNGCASETTADSDGRFSFAEIALGRFAIQAGSQVTRESGMGYGELAYAGATSYVKIALAGLGSVTGTVVDNGALFAGAKVVLEKSPDAGCGAATCTTYSDPVNGRFSFVNVPAGTFSLYAEDPANAQKNGSAGGVLTPGGTAEVEVAFADTGSLKAKVLFANGSAAAGVIAELKRLDGFALYRDTDATGLVTFNGVPKGDYLLTLQDPAGSGLAKKPLQIINDLDLSNEPLMLDEAAPSVKSVSPLPGEIRVPTGSPIVITFSEPVQPGSINGTTISISSASGEVAGFRVLSANDTVLTFTPLQPLNDETLFTIRVAGVHDRVDRPQLQSFVATFTTLDVTPPAIVSISPAQGSSGAPLESVVRVMFSEPVNPTAFTGQAITVADGNGPLAGRVDMVFGNTGMVFTPTYPLAANSTYTVTLLPARDLAGNQQSAVAPFTFNSLDRTPPVISSLSAPASVVENATITVTPVFAGGHDIAVVDWYLNGAPAGAVRLAQSATYSFSFQAIPTLGVPGGTPIRVTAIATDTSGNRGLTGTDAQVTVTADSPPTASITLPTGGTSVQNNERVVVRVEANDDLGITRIAYQAAGGRFPAADTAAVTPATAAAQREFAFYVPADALPGSKIIVNATVVDSKGQTGKATPVAITVSDAIAPAVTFAGIASGDIVRPGQKITVVVSASDLGGINRISFRANNGAWEQRDISPAQNPVAATFSYTVPLSFTAHDLVRLEASATDAAGNIGSAPAVVLPVADITPPQVTIATANNSSFMVPGNTVTVLVDAQDDTNVAGISLTGTGAFTYSDSVTVTPAGTVQKSFTINIPANLANGVVLTLAATTTDTSGNVSQPVTLNLTAMNLTTVQLPPSQLLSAGDVVQLSITLDQPAPAAGMQLDLAPAGNSIQLQPANLRYAAGETVKNFSLSALVGGNDAIVVSNQGVSLGRVTVTVRGGIVAGRVVTMTQQPVSGAELMINGIATTSGSDGTFQAEGVTGPAVTVRAYDPVNNLQGAASGTMNAANGFLKGLTVTLTSAGAVSGTVKLADLTLVGPGIQVNLMDPQNKSQALFTAFTAADGSYSFQQVPLGTYSIEASDTNANRGRSTAYLTTSGAEVSVPIVFLGKGTVTGTVRNASGTGVANLAVTLQSSSIFGGVNRSAITDDNGSFTFADVSVGTFSLTTKDDASNLGANTAGSVTLHGQTVTANLNLGAWASLEGHVYRADGSTPAAGATVKAGSQQTTTDSDGFYRFEVLPLSYYTVAADDPTTRVKAQAGLSLQLHQENRIQDLTLNGSGSVVVTVVDDTSTPVAGASVQLVDGYGTLRGISDSVGTLIFEHAYPGTYEVQGVLGAKHGTARGSITADQQLYVSVTIAADPSGTITGTVFAPDGQTPAGGVTVTARTAGCSYYNCAATTMTTAGDGTFQFATLPLGAYDLLVNDASYQLRAKSTSIIIDTNGQSVNRNLTMIGLGTVNGRVLEPNSSTGSPNMPVTIRSLHPDFGRSFSVRTNAAGFYQVDLVPIGDITVNAGEISQQKLGDASGTLSGDGATLTLDVALQSNAVTLSQYLYDGNNLPFNIQGNGTVTNNAFGYSGGAGLLELTPSGGSPVAFAAVTSGTQEQSGREIALRQADMAGLSVTRKVYVPQDGYFARYLEIIDNLTGSDKSVTVGVKSNLYSAESSYYSYWVEATSNNDKLLQTGGQSPDYWVAFDNSYYYGGSTTRAAMVWGGAGAAVAASQVTATPSTTSATGLASSWNLTIPSNGRVAIMHFLVQNVTLAGAKASAERLVQLPPEALAGLSQDELLAIRNFAVPLDGSSPLSALPPLTGIVSVDVNDSLGATLSDLTVPVFLQSANPIFSRTYELNTNNGQVTFTSNMNATWPAIALPLGPYTVTAKRLFDGICGYYSCSNPTPMAVSSPGDFTGGATQAATTLTFAATGNIGGVVRKTTGETVANSTIVLTNNNDLQLTTYTPAEGSYAFKVIKPGAYTLKTSVPSVNGWYNDTPINVSQQVTIVAGQAVMSDVILPPLGIVTGQLFAWNGTVLSNATVNLRNPDNTFQRSNSTDTGGHFNFAMVPPGTYLIDAADPVTNAQTVSHQLTMVNGETITQDLQLKKSGRFMVTVQYADGSQVPNFSYNHQLDLFDAGDNSLAYSTSNSANPFTTNSFASNASQFRVKITQSYNQPSYYSNYKTYTAFAESTVDGFAGASSDYLPLSVKLPINRGNLTVQLQNSTGANYSGSALPIELRDPVNNDLWGSCTTSNSSGNCTISNLAAGPDGISVKLIMNGTVIAETTGFLTASGQTQTVTLQLPYDPVAFPKTLYDGNALEYDVYKEGGLYYGKNSVFRQYNDVPGAMVMSVAQQGQSATMFTGSTNGLAEDQGRELVTSQTGIAGLNVTRKIYVPADGYFARYLDILSNPGTQPVTIDLDLAVKFGYGNYDAAIKAASDGSNDLTPADRILTGGTWAVVNDTTDTDPFQSYSNFPAIALVWSGTAATRPPSVVSFTSRQSNTSPATLKSGYQTVTVNPGESVALMSFLVQQISNASARASAERLVQLPPEALAGLSSQERALIVNFTVPSDGISALAPLPALNGTITGAIKPYDGQSSGLSTSAVVQVHSTSPYFGRTYGVSANSTTRAFTFTGNPSGTSGAIAIPLTDFTLQGSMDLRAYSVSLPQVNGSFPSGQATTVQDILLTSTGRLNTMLLRYDGTPIANATVRATFGSNCQTDYCSSTNGLPNAGSGSYPFDFAKDGQHNLTATIPAPTGNGGGSDLVAKGSVTAVSNATTQFELRLPQLGSIAGTVRNLAGTAVASNYLRLTSKTDSNFSRYFYTYNGSDGGPAGTYLFADLPADTYLLEVRDNSTYIYYRYTVTVTAGAAVTQECQYGLSGTITGSVSFKTAGDPTYVPTNVNIEVWDLDSNTRLTSTDTYNNTFTTQRFASIGKPITLKATYQYYTDSGNRTYSATTSVPDFTSDGQQQTANVSLPLDRGNVQVQLVDSDNAPFTKLVTIQLRDATGGLVSYTTYNQESQYTFNNVYTDLTNLTARVTYMGRNMDMPFTFVPNGTAMVTVAIPLITMNGAVFAGDGTTPLTGFSYRLTTADGNYVYPCGSQASWSGYWYNNYSVYRYYINDSYSCTSSDGTWRLNELVYLNPTDGGYNYTAVPRKVPIQLGDQLTLQITHSLLGTYNHTFTFDGTTPVTATLPIFVAKGSVKRQDASGVPNASVTMIVTEATAPPTDHTYGGTTDGSGNFTILGTKLGTITLDAQTSMGATASYAGGGTITSFNVPATGLDMVLEPTGSITGTVTRGGIALYDAQVMLTMPDRALERFVWSDNSGNFTVADIPLGNYTVSSRFYDEGSGGYLYSNTGSGTLTSQAPTANIPLSFDLPPGTVYGVVRDDTGSPLPGAEVTLTRASTGELFYLNTDGNGTYFRSNLPPDGYVAYGSYYVGEVQNLIGSSYGLLAEGGTLLLDLNLRPRVSLSTELSVANDPYIYLISSGAVLSGGGSSSLSFSSPFDYNNLYYLAENVTDQLGNLAFSRSWLDQNGQMVFRPAVRNGKVYQRKIFLPPGGGYLRYLEIVNNPAASPVTVWPYLFGSLASPAAGSWDYLVNPATAATGYAVLQAANDPAMPRVGMVLQGSGTVAAQVKTDLASATAPKWYWEETAPAGDKACVLHFIFQGGPLATDMETKAQALRSLDGAALNGLGIDANPLFGLTTEERACVKNFTLPAP